jgi:hypothetical protein
MARFLRHAPWRFDIFDVEVGLVGDLVARGLVGKLGDKLVGLDIDILFAGKGFRGPHIASEEFFSGLSSLLLDFLRIKSFLVGLEKLVRVGASRDDHGGVGGSTENTLVKGDVLGLVFRLGTTVGVFILLLLVNDTRLRTVEALALLLFHHLSLLI